MVNEPDDSNGYTDELLRAYLERYPSTDERGVDPYYYDTATDPPTQVATPGWYPVWDTHAAAADIWDEKAAGEADEYDYPLIENQPGVARRSQLYDQYSREARKHRGRRRAGTVTLIASPSPNRAGGSDIVFNR